MENQSDDLKLSRDGDATAADAASPVTPATPGLLPSRPPSSTGSAGQRPYVPQFSAATQMILSRINSKPGSLSAALSSASSIAKSIEKSAFEDAKRRLVMNMNTSLTMPMPTLTPKPGSSNSMRDSFQLRTSAPVTTPATAKPTPAKPAASKPLPSKQKGKAPRGTKRKRSKENDDTTSNTASAQKRKHYGKRTVEQALCKVCTRGLSPNMNQIVFCDGCNFCWHQMCHEPYIDDDFVSNETRSWFCGRCLAKREKALARKKTLSEHKGVSWAAKGADQSYTQSSPSSPGQEPGVSKRGAQGQSAGPATPSSLPRADIKLVGPTNFTSAVSTPDATATDGGGKAKPKRKSSTEAPGQAERGSSVESIPPAWPKTGQGVLQGLDVNEEDLRDKNDFEAFSVASYDSKGQKVMENGMAV
ncbi:hypothetical protein CIB48_g6849 [Xylaria polymorpha]|nr:hypothetical protein CIB48_g6849 [Xylaria polymorpha]